MVWGTMQHLIPRSISSCIITDALAFAVSRNCCLQSDGFQRNSQTKFKQVSDRRCVFDVVPRADGTCATDLPSIVSGVMRLHVSCARRTTCSLHACNGVQTFEILCRYARKVRRLFQTMDDSHDGAISLEAALLECQAGFT